MFPLLLLSKWKWAVGAAVVVALVVTYFALKAQISDARADAAQARGELAAERLTLAEALAARQAEVIETQERASSLVSQSARSFNDKIVEIRGRYAARGNQVAPPLGEPGGVDRQGNASSRSGGSDGVLSGGVRNDAPGASSGTVPETTGAPGGADGPTADDGATQPQRPLDERCAETTQQVIDLQEFILKQRELFNSTPEKAR